MGREYEGTFRNSYLVDPKGKIVKIFENVNPLHHPREVLESLIRYKIDAVSTFWAKNWLS